MCGCLLAMGLGRRAALRGLACLAGSSALALGSARRAGAARPPFAWTDVHVHLLLGRGNPRAGLVEAADSALAAMDRDGIARALLMPPPLIDGMPGIYDLDGLKAAVARAPHRLGFLAGGGSLNPLLHAAGPTDSGRLARFETAAREIAAAGAAGFGEIAAHHVSIVPGHPYEAAGADHPLLLRLAEIAAREGLPIELHHDLVVADMPPPAMLRGENPPVLKANLAGFERLLAHARDAKIVWAHGGSGPLGTATAPAIRDLLARHANLRISLRLGPQGGRTGPGPAGAAGPPQRVLEEDGTIAAAWLSTLAEFPDRFVLGGDQFFAAGDFPAQGPGAVFARLAEATRAMSADFLSRLPPDLARAIGETNAGRIYRL
ncbi:MAG: amidohydrolase family protein [Proteobacteria bacterium]|nr:amidohydrolase family protein [Pseudomonadota bacterium]